MSNNFINNTNKAQLAAQQQAKDTNSINAKQAGLLLASTKVLAQNSNELATIPQGLADAIDKAKADPAVWNSFTAEEKSQLLVDREDFLKQAVTFREQSVVINEQAVQLEAELTQMTFNGEKLDTNIQLTEETLRENAGVPADFTISSASSIDDPASLEDPLIPPPLGPVNSEFTELTEAETEALFASGDPAAVDQNFIDANAEPQNFDPEAVDEFAGVDEQIAANENDLQEPPLLSPEEVDEAIFNAGIDVDAEIERAAAESNVENFEPGDVDEFTGIDEQIAANENDLQEPPLLSPEEVDAEIFNAGIDVDAEIFNAGIDQDDASGENATIQAATIRAQAQQAIESQLGQAANGDWRVKLRLAGGAFYLYKDPDINQDGILWPLAITDGVVFPYTPKIDTTYGANYSQYDLTHSNYRGYFYQNSYVDEISINATFTAQDTSEANYLLAVIHFFRSVTKMFYGQDPNRGSPPPLVFLQGLGEYQFNLHPCVVKTFNYNLPNDVDYIRARVANINGTSLLQRRDRQAVSSNPIVGAIDRLRNAGLPKGAMVSRPAPPTLGTTSPTYVPTKMEISISLLPIQTRDQISQQFSLREFASGDLLKGGFW